MIKLYENGIYLVNGETICSCPEEAAQKSGRATTKEEATKGTMAYGILQAHNQSSCLASSPPPSPTAMVPRAP